MTNVLENLPNGVKEHLLDDACHHVSDASTGAMSHALHRLPSTISHFGLSLPSQILDRYAHNAELKTGFWHQRPASQTWVRCCPETHRSSGYCDESTDSWTLVSPFMRWPHLCRCILLP